MFEMFMIESGHFLAMPVIYPLPLPVILSNALRLFIKENFSKDAESAVMRGMFQCYPFTGFAVVLQFLEHSSILKFIFPTGFPGKF